MVDPIHQIYMQEFRVHMASLAQSEAAVKWHTQKQSGHFNRMALDAEGSFKKTVSNAGRMAFRYTYYALIVGRLAQYTLSRLFTKPFIKAGEEIDKMRGRLAILSQETGQYIKVLEGTAFQLSLALPHTLTQVLSGMTEMVKAGTHLRDVFDDIQSASYMALLSGRSMAEEARFLSTVVGVYGTFVTASGEIRRYTTEQLADIHALAQTMSRFSHAELATALQNVIGPAAAYGIGYEELVSSVLFYARAGIEPAAAGTMFRRLFTHGIKEQFQVFSASAIDWLRRQVPYLLDETSDLHRRYVEIHDQEGKRDVVTELVERIGRAPTEQTLENLLEAPFWVGTALRVAQAMGDRRVADHAIQTLTQIMGVREATPFLALAGVTGERDGTLLAGIQLLQTYVAELKNAHGETDRMMETWKQTYSWAKDQATATSEAFRGAIGTPMMEIKGMATLMKTSWLGAITGMLTGTYDVAKILEKLVDEGMDRFEAMRRIALPRTGESHPLILQAQRIQERGSTTAALLGQLALVAGSIIRISALAGLGVSAWGLMSVKAGDVRENFARGLTSGVTGKSYLNLFAGTQIARGMVGYQPRDAAGRWMKKTMLPTQMTHTPEFTPSTVATGMKLPLMGRMPTHLATGLMMGQITAKTAIWEWLKAAKGGPFGVIAAAVASIMSLFWMWNEDLAGVRTAAQGAVGALRDVDRGVDAVVELLRALGTLLHLRPIVSGLRQGVNVALHGFALAVRGITEVAQFSFRIVSAVANFTPIRFITDDVIGLVAKIYFGFVGFVGAITVLAWSVSLLKLRTMQLAGWIKRKLLIQAGMGLPGAVIALAGRTGRYLGGLLEGIFITTGKVVRWFVRLVTGQLAGAAAGVGAGAFLKGKLAWIAAGLMRPIATFIYNLFHASTALMKFYTWMTGVFIPMLQRHLITRFLGNTLLRLITWMRGLVIAKGAATAAGLAASTISTTAVIGGAAAAGAGGAAAAKATGAAIAAKTAAGAGGAAAAGTGLALLGMKTMGIGLLAGGAIYGLVRLFSSLANRTEGTYLDQMDAVSSLVLRKGQLPSGALETRSGRQLVHSLRKLETIAPWETMQLDQELRRAETILAAIERNTRPISEDGPYVHPADMGFGDRARYFKEMSDMWMSEGERGGLYGRFHTAVSSGNWAQAMEWYERIRSQEVSVSVTNNIEVKGDFSEDDAVRIAHTIEDAIRRAFENRSILDGYRSPQTEMGL